MARRSNLSAEQEAKIRDAHARGETYRGIARAAGVSEGAVVRALARIVDRTRRASEFRSLTAVRAPRRTEGAYGWDLESIRAARDDQMRGHFARPVRLAEAMRTDDALFTAYHNRLAPQSAVRADLVSCGGTRGDSVRRKALASVVAPFSVIVGLHGTLANHGVAIGHVVHEASDDGTRVDMRLEEWPLEHVRWNDSTEDLETRTRDHGTVPITHGDGQWIVFRKFADRPWRQEACLLPGALIYAARGNGVRDWAAASFSHGQAKMIGELPSGISLADRDGNLTPEAEAFLRIMQDIMSGDVAAGIRPPGSKTDFVSNGSTAWQVFSELILNRDKAAARVYLGTDAILGSQGGAPGVDIAALFGVATTKIQGDFRAIEQGLHTGLYEPWTAINFGSSTYAPALVYQMPDPDALAKAEECAKKNELLLGTIKRMREEQMIVTQETVNALAAQIGVSPAPVLVALEAQAVPLTLAPTDVAKVVRVREARAAQGLPPFGDARDDMTITELDEQNKARAQA